MNKKEIDKLQDAVKQLGPAILQRYDRKWIQALIDGPDCYLEYDGCLNSMMSTVVKYRKRFLKMLINVDV